VQKGYMQMETMTPPDIPNLAARLRDLTCGYWVSQCIATAARLGIADILKSDTKSVEELAATTQTQPRALYRLLRALASFGIFAESSERCFSLTPMAELLQTSPQSLRGWAILMAQEEFHRAWEELLYSLKTGKPAFNHIFGKSYWEHLSGNPEAALTFNEGLTAYTSQVARAVVSAHDFSLFPNIVDVGAGHGTLMAAILTATPQVVGHAVRPAARSRGSKEDLGSLQPHEALPVCSREFFRVRT
jgi:O-methyltransferase domain/Dimerisation domain